MIMAAYADPLTEELLAKPVGPVRPKVAVDIEFTSQIEVVGNTLTATIRDDQGTVTDGRALAFLKEEGQNPDDWEPAGFKKSSYGTLDNPLEAVSFTFKRRLVPGAAREPLDLDELFKEIKKHKPKASRPDGDSGFLVLLGDMQFGKIDGDGVDGTLRRTIDCLNSAADRLVDYRKRFDIGHVHVGWLGDHIEGFVSQGGANVFRTPLTLNEQIRLTRRVMLHALVTFAPLAERVTFAAVPGNHGETIRFAGKGTTRYDDSHDTESLIAVHDAAQLNPEAFGHVKFFVPQTDEMTVLVDVAGTTVAHAHGHQWRPGKHFEWWKGQSFNADSPMHSVDLLAAGHLHHEFADSDGWRQFLQVPAMESESTWFKHSRGTGGAPGLVVAITKNGNTDVREIVR